jgi:hypothetical protein
LFRRIVTVDAASPIEAARLVLTADNTFECWINGQRAGSGEDFHRGYPMNVKALLKPGANLLAVAAVNTLDMPNPAGLVGALRISYRDGRTQEVLTDGAWESAQAAPENWMTDTASAQGWSAAMELGPMGMAPWGDVQESPEAVDQVPDIAIPSRVLAQMGLPPDFKGSSNLRYIHKRIGETDVYFVANPEPREIEAICTFRVGGKQPELWRPDTGSTEPAAACEMKDGCTSLPLRFDPSGSMFVVFRKAASGEAVRGKNWLEFKPVQEIAGPWEVSFDPKWGGPEKTLTFDKLEDWSKRPEQGVRYYSGTSLYRTKFTLSAQPSSLNRCFLDLGKVAIMAKAKLNGHDLGTLWKPPFRVEVTAALKAGENTLELRVVNLWINRMIGDEQLPEDSDRHPNGTLKSWPAWLAEGKPSPTGRFTFTSWRLWKKDDPLFESGLLGPVMLRTVER